MDEPLPYSITPRLRKNNPPARRRFPHCLRRRAGLYFLPRFPFFSTPATVMPRLSLVVLASLAALLLAGPAQAQSKQPLDHDAYARWNRIEEEAISDDGRWALLSLGPEDGDAELRVKSLDTEQAYRVPRGVEAHFTADSRHVVFLIKPPKEDVRQAKRDGKKDDALPKDSLGLLALDTGALEKIAAVKSYKLPEEAGGVVAYLLEKPPADTTAAKDEKEQEEEKQEEEDEKKDKKKKDKPEGTPLVLRTLATGAETRFEDAVAYRLSEDGRRLVYAASNKDGTADGVFSVETATGAATPLSSGGWIEIR